MTYADKYALMKAYKIITGDDPDQEHSPDTAKYQSSGGNKTATPAQLKILKEVYTGERLDKLLALNNISKIEDLSIAKASELISKLREKK